MRSSWEVFIGRTFFWMPVYYNLKGRTPHICIAGATGSGKSEFLKTLLYSICQKHDAENLEIRIIDLKEGATFAAWLHAPQVTGVYDTTDTAYDCLCDMEREMRRRLQLIKQARFNFVKEPRFKELLVVFDEGGELSPGRSTGLEKKTRQECMQMLSTLVRVSREAQMHVVYTTQRPDADTLPTEIRSQLEARFCFRVKEDIDSRIVLRHNGAEQLPLIPGRMIMQTPFKEQEVQAAYCPPEYISSWLRQFVTAPTYGIPAVEENPVVTSDWE